MSRPELTALLNQADGAARHGERIMAALAEHSNGTLARRVSAGPAATVLARFTHRAATGQLACCDHLGTSPEPAWWCAWRPGLDASAAKTPAAAAA